MLAEVVYYLGLFVIWYFLAISFMYTLLLMLSISDVYKRFKEEEIGNIIALMQSKALPPITIIVPAFNEEKSIIDNIKSILNNDYQNKQIIIVNPDSEDETLNILIKEFNLFPVTPTIAKKIETVGKIRGYYISKTHPNIVVLDKTIHDKSDALNMAINACRTPLFISFDADSILEPDAISNIIFYTLTHSHSVAVGGSVYLLNSCEQKDGVIIDANFPNKPTVAYQVCEYLKSFLFARSGWNFFGGSLCFAGAFTLFETQAMREVNGFDIANRCQDYEIIVKLHMDRRQKKYPYKILFDPKVTCWTEAPSTLKEYWHQRFSWQYYTMMTLMMHIHMLFNPRYGVVGLFSYPCYLFFEALGCIVEASAYILIPLTWYLGILDSFTTLLLVIICWLFIILLTVVTGLINYFTFNKYGKLRDLIWIFNFAALSILGFRQFDVICRTCATFKYLFDMIATWSLTKMKKIK